MPREDGRFDLYHSNGYAQLVVYPPQGGKPVYPEDVLNRMRILRIPRVPVARIQDIIDEAAGRPVRLVEWPAGAELSSSVVVSISDDAMKAFVSMRAPRKGGGIPSKEVITRRLADEGVVYGIDEAAVDDLLERRVFDTPVCVARGTAPVHGRPPAAEFSFETEVGRPFLVDESGRVDLRELNFIQQKHEGDVLVRFHPAVEAVDGKDVRGRPVEARAAGATTLVKPGRNAGYNEDETAIVALADGNAFVKSNAVHVEPVVVVDGVDYQTGNITFEGSVRIKRGVADGFTVRVGGCLEVGECVGRATLVVGRDLLLRGGMNGGNEGTVECSGSVYAKFLESASLSCSGNLLVTDAVMHSQVKVHGNLGLRGKHAELIGGSILVGGNLWCRKIGSVAETPTRLSVGVDPQLILEASRLYARAEALRDRIDDLDRIARHIEAQLKAGAETAPDTLTKVRLERGNNEDEVRGIEARLREVRASMKPPSGARVVVEEQIYPRVIISFGVEEYRSPAAGTGRTILKIVDNGIIDAGFNPEDPPDFETLIGTDDFQPSRSG